MKSVTDEELKKIQIDILVAVDDFCKSNSLKYYLSYGTLLGAIRHHGFIPWDDDIDITMPYPDYMFLIKNFRHKYYRVNSIFTNKNYPYHLMKIDDIRTRLIEKTSTEYKIGINIDVSPLIGLPNDKKQAIRYFKKIEFWRSNVLLAKNVENKKRSLYKTVAISFFRYLPMSRYSVIKHIDMLSSKYNYDNSKYTICVGSFNRYKEIAPKELFNQDITHVFEDRYFRIPYKYDEWLTILFGDYMKLPPVEKQVTHHDFECYWRE